MDVVGGDGGGSGGAGSNCGAPRYVVVHMQCLVTRGRQTWRSCCGMSNVIAVSTSPKSHDGLQINRTPCHRNRWRQVSQHHRHWLISLFALNLCHNRPRTLHTSANAQNHQLNREHGVHTTHDSLSVAHITNQYHVLRRVGVVVILVSIFFFWSNEMVIVIIFSDFDSYTLA